MSDKIAEIRARHEINDRYRGWHPGAHKDRAALLAEVERLQGLLNGFSRDMVEEIERLTRELNEARAEVARLLLGSEVLASHQGSPGREWHGAGAWLYPGDTINVVRAPLEAKP
jgi:hypothetical protein